MSNKKLYEVVIPDGKRSVIRAVSTIDIHDTSSRETDRMPVIVHPGWAKSPERHSRLMSELDCAGFLPIGVDTRNADDKQGDGKSRRPASLLRLCDWLSIDERLYVGHSEGGRVVSQAALSSKDQAKGLVIVNGVGIGDSSKGVQGMIASNIHTVQGISGSEGSVLDMVSSGIESTLYMVRHPIRTLNEKKVIQNTDGWATASELANQGIAVSVFHAKSDELVSHAESLAGAALYPEVTFRSTEGYHNNVYRPEMRSLIVKELLLMA